MLNLKLRMKYILVNSPNKCVQIMSLARRTQDVLAASKILVNEVVSVREGEGVLLISDLPVRWALIQAVLDEVLRAGGHPHLLSFNVVSDNEDIPAYALQLVDAAQALILITNRSLSFSKHVLNSLRSGKRVASCPRTDEGMFCRALSVKPSKLARETNAVASIINSASTVEVISGEGVLKASVSGRKVLYVDGLADVPGKFTIIPGGIVGVAPIENSVHGEVSVNGSITGLGVVSSRVRLTVESGEVVKISGGNDARKLAKLLDSYKDTDMYKVCEVGVGVHPLMRVRGNPTEDESARGVIVVGLGENTHLGGSIAAPDHVDLTIVGATLKVDSSYTLVSNGELRVMYPE